MTHDDARLANVNRFFSDLIDEHGPIPKAADYPDPGQQILRYDELAKLFTNAPRPFSLLDYGCGYGAFYDYVRERGFEVDYWGYDISEPMIAAAKAAHPDMQDRFLPTLPVHATYDFAIVSGTFNRRAGTSIDAWESLVHDALDDFHRRTRLGFAFNMLSGYRETHRKLDVNYYGDPLHYFDLCFRKYSPNIALTHDYNLWDFTIIVRKLPPRQVPTT